MLDYMSLGLLPVLVDAKPPFQDSFLSLLLQIVLAHEDELHSIRYFIQTIT
jgi:hypothetical protein